MSIGRLWMNAVGAVHLFGTPKLAAVHLRGLWDMAYIGTPDLFFFENAFFEVQLPAPVCVFEETCFFKLVTNT